MEGNAVNIQQLNEQLSRYTKRMDNLLNNINYLFIKNSASEFELKRLEKEAEQFTHHADSAAEGYMALGLLAGLRFEVQKAYDFFEKSLHLSPTDPLILANYAKVKNFLADALGALNTIRLAIKTSPLPLIVEQGVFIALSALQIEQASKWQSLLTQPLLIIPKTWLDSHKALLNSLSLTPDDLTRYRDSAAGVLTCNRLSADQGNIVFRDDGSLLYRFNLPREESGDVEVLNAIDKGFAAVAHGSLARVVGLMCGVPSQFKSSQQTLLASFDSTPFSN